MTDQQPERPTQSLAEVVATGDYLESLKATRDYVAQCLDTCESMRDAAALTARLADLLQQIEAVPNKAEVSAADEVARRRAARRTGSNRPSRAKGAS